MPTTVLIVDDSQFFCRRIGAILNSSDDIKVVGVANNGKQAIEQAARLKPDIITLDVEMPIMDGITAVKEIVKVCDAKVLMLSSLTDDNARTTLDALDAGATDFLLKSYESLSDDSGGLAQHLLDKVKQFVRAKAFVGLKSIPRLDVATPTLVINDKHTQTASKNYRLLAIGASTGGPVALQKLLQALPKNFPVPITITQHMPATFTGKFAERLNGMCQLEVCEASDGMAVKAGHVYVAPGGKQMVFEGPAVNARLRIRSADARLQFSPSVDVTFGSASKIYAGNVLAIILTGMGSDGTEGCKLLKANGAKIWTQNEASCVVYGMPMSVTKAGLSEREFPIEQFAKEIIREI
ncbi:MAG: chemotaxis response regulator protein-glutamate methylesterase [Kangiellaceae bacterium]|nr:chemotaxis response regulator protein-glutamate methylesterase [Kangiellaceae bacterium]